MINEIENKLDAKVMRAKNETDALHEKIKYLLDVEPEDFNSQIKEWFVAVGMIDRIINDLKEAKMTIVHKVID